MPLYLVKDHTGTDRLINAKSPQGAKNHVIGSIADKMAVSTPTALEVATLVSGGVAVEHAANTREGQREYHAECAEEAQRIEAERPAHGDIEAEPIDDEIPEWPKSSLGEDDGQDELGQSEADRAPWPDL